MQDMDNTSKPFRLENPEHEALRQELLRKYRTPHYNCAAFTRAFAERFPALRRVPGYYYDSPGGFSCGEHWWLVDSAGRIVDPTADQFRQREFGHYVPYDPWVHTIAKGKCPNCGEPLHSCEGQGPCSPECAEALSKDLGVQLTRSVPYESEMDFKCDMDLVLKYGCKFTKVPAVAALIEAALAAQPMTVSHSEKELADA